MGEAVKQEDRTETQRSAVVVGTPHHKKAVLVLSDLELEPVPQLNRSNRQIFFFKGCLNL